MTMSAKLDPSFGEKVYKLRSKHRFNQRDLAKMLKVSVNTLQSYEKGAVPHGPNLINLAKSLQCSLDWLCGLSKHLETGDALEFDTSPKLIVYPPFLVEGDSSKLSACSFDWAWLALMVSNPDNVACSFIHGPAMAPILMDGDLVLVDKGATQIKGQGDIFAVRIEEVVAFYRLETRPYGVLRLISGNQDLTPAFEVSTDDIEIIGQVFLVMRSLKN